MRVELGAPILINGDGLLHIAKLEERPRSEYPLRGKSICRRRGTVVLFAEWMAGHRWCATCSRKGPRVFRVPKLTAPKFGRRRRRG